MTANRLHTLDAMRGIAAIAVVLLHFGPAAPQLATRGYLAVDFFFALSGLVIGRAYEARLNDGRLSAARFALLRIVRLYPLYALGTAIGIAKAALSPFVGSDGGASLHAPVVGAAFAVLMLPSPGDPDSLFPFNFPAWSLFLELVVNLAFALALARLPTRLLGAVIAVAAAALVALVVRHGSIDLGARWATLDGGAVRTLFGFATGMMIGRTWRPARIRSGPGALLPPLLLAALLLVPVPAAARPWLDLGCALVAMPLLVMLGMAVEPPAAGLWLAGWLGDVSYPLYAVHAPFVQAAMRVIVLARLPAAPLIVATLALLLGLATLLARYYDARARDWLSARLGLRPSAPLQAA